MGAGAPSVAFQVFPGRRATTSVVSTPSELITLVQTLACQPTRCLPSALSPRRSGWPPEPVRKETVVVHGLKRHEAWLAAGWAS